MENVSEKLQEKGLPSKEILEKELGPLHLEKEEFLVDDVIKQLREKIGLYLSFLEHIVHPESNIVELVEANSFSEAEREKAYSLFTELLYWQRKYHLIQLNPSQEELSNYAVELLHLWQEKKEQVRQIVQQAVETWNHQRSLQQAKQSYLG